MAENTGAENIGGETVGAEKDAGEAVFHAESLKLKFLAAVAAAGGAWFDWLALSGGREDAGASPAALLATGVLLLGAAVILWRQGADPRPVLIVGPDGLEDRMHGVIAWEDVRSFRHHASFFSPCFGYDLKKDVEPPENAPLFRFNAMMNRLSGLPSRVFRKKLVAGGPEPMAAACRRFRPDLEGR